MAVQPKSSKSLAGSFELKTPCDRAGTFEPQLLTKHLTHLTDELERKVIALFALGNSCQDIRTHIADLLYGVELSNSTLNPITDKLLAAARAAGLARARSVADLPHSLARCHSLQNPRERPLYQQGNF
jgi:transposase-like protein